MAQRQTLAREGLIKGGVIELAALQTRPGVVMGVGGVDRPQKVTGQATLLLEAGKRLEGA